MIKLSPATLSLIPIAATLTRLLYRPNVYICLSFIFALSLFALIYFLDHEKDERYRALKKEIADIKDQLTMLGMSSRRK